MVNARKKIEGYGRTGKYSDQGAKAAESRLQGRFDSDLITQKSRKERAKTLLAERAAKNAPKPVMPAATQAAKPAAVETGPNSPTIAGARDVLAKIRAVKAADRTDADFDQVDIQHARGVNLAKTMTDPKMRAKFIDELDRARAGQYGRVGAQNPGRTPIPAASAAAAVAVQRPAKSAETKQAQIDRIREKLRSRDASRNIMRRSLENENSERRNKIDRARTESSKAARQAEYDTFRNQAEKDIGRQLPATYTGPPAAATAASRPAIAPGRGTPERNRKAAELATARTLAQRGPGGGRSIFGINPSRAQAVVARARVAMKAPKIQLDPKTGMAFGRGTEQRQSLARSIQGYRAMISAGMTTSPIKRAFNSIRGIAAENTRNANAKVTARGRKLRLWQLDNIRNRAKGV